MPRRRFFVPPENIKHGIARLPPDQIHHLRDVLRLRPGDPVEIFDGKGVGYRGKVAREGSDVVAVGEAAGQSRVELLVKAALGVRVAAEQVPGPGERGGGRLRAREEDAERLEGKLLVGYPLPRAEAARPLL